MAGSGEEFPQAISDRGGSGCLIAECEISAALPPPRQFVGVSVVSSGIVTGTFLCRTDPETRPVREDNISQ